MYSRCTHWLKSTILPRRTEREMGNRRHDTHVLILLWLINFQMWWLWNRQTKHCALCRAAVAFGWTCKFVFIVVFEASTSLCLSPFGDLRRSRSASGACLAFSVTVSPEWKQVSGDVVQASADFFLFLYLFIYFFHFHSEHSPFKLSCSSHWCFLLSGWQLLGCQGKSLTCGGQTHVQ